MEKHPFPSVIDSSMRSTFVNCPQSFYNEYILGLSARGESTHLVFGGAFAKGVEITRREFYQNGKGAQEAIHSGAISAIAEYGDHIPPTEGSGSYKTVNRCVEALVAYFTEHPLYSDHIQPWEDDHGKPCIEFSFAYPLDLINPSTGEPLIFAGRFDMVGEHTGTGLCLGVDEKTTSQLGAQWLKQWDLRGQFTGYTWAAKKAGYPCAGVVVRGISILKNSFGHAEVLSLRSDYLVKLWEEQLYQDIQRMIQCWQSNTWDYNFDSACTAYGGCKFTRLCNSPNPERFYDEFARTRWNPVSGKREDMKHVHES